MSNLPRPLLFVLLATLAASAALAGVRWRQEEARARAAADLRRRLPKQVDEGGYVSSSACKACHPSQYASWYGAHHRKMTQAATPETVQAPFDGVKLTLGGQRYALERRGDEFWMDVPEPSSLDPDARATLRIYMVTGSHNMQAFWFQTPTTGRLYLAPLTYLIEDRKWVRRPDVFLTGPLEPGQRPPTQIWNTGCIECHATAAQPRPRRDSVSGVEYSDTRLGELGISCEACHGPGEAHIAANQQPLHRYWLHASGAADPTIANPARLSPRASSQICGACHTVFRMLDMQDFFEHGPAFRPGADRDDSRVVVRPRIWDATPTLRDQILRENPRFVEWSFWKDGLPRVSGRDYSSLVESQCWKGGKLSCVSCHSVHSADPNDQLKEGMDGDEACYACHEKLRENVTAHTHHPVASAGSRCMNCHMPYTTYGLLKAIRSHTIANPRASETLEVGRPNACNLCHLDRSVAWAGRELHRLFGQPVVDTSAEPEVAAAVVWTLRGDAGLRALVASSLGWRPAQEASGTAWMMPYLAELLDDPYAAVRYIAQRSLRTIDKDAAPTYDYVAPRESHQAAKTELKARWAAHPILPGVPARPELLLDGDGRLDEARVRDLLGQRDNRRIDLTE